jgi:hypothetical protein
MRPTDVCHPYDLRAPASRAFPASSRDFRRVDTPQGLRPCAVVTGGPNGSRRSRPLRRIVPHTTPTLFAFQCLPRAFCLTAFRTRAWAFSSHGARTNRASDIPVASSRLAPSCSNRPCDLPVQMTRDASHRRLPPKRFACTRISCVPSFLSRFSPGGYPAES